MLKYVAILAFLLPFTTPKPVALERAAGRMCSVEDGAVPAQRSLAEMTLFPRAIDSRGYRLNIVVLYDDTFSKQFKGNAVPELKKIVAVTNDIFKKKSLKIKIQLDAMAIENAKGRTWDGEHGSNYLDECGKVAKTHRIKDANNYVCIGGKPSGHAAGGVAFKGSVCDINREMRIAYTQYVTMSGDTGMDLTPAQMTISTAEVFAHEIGHTLGMDHDFKGQDSTKLKKKPSGKGLCTGVMDYTDTTDEWSDCSNADMAKYINGLKKNCLKPIGTTGASTDWSEGTPEGGDGGAGGNISTDVGGAGGECKPPICIMGPDYP